MTKRLLHGILRVTIFEIDHFSSPGCCPPFHKLFLDNKKHEIRSGTSTGKLYAAIDLETVKVAHTRLLLEYAPDNPIWNESFHIYCAHMTSHVAFCVKEDDHHIGTTLVGKAILPVEKIMDGNEVEEWLPLLNKHGKPIHRGSKIRVKVQFVHVSKNCSWGNGIDSVDFSGVPNTYFGQRNGCRVTLYQDAHIPDDFNPKIEFSDGKNYEQNRCWEDVFDAIYNAKHLIYIAGWSVSTEITLVRDLKRSKREGQNMSLGELLVKKADEGVRVLMLVWDDRTSNIIIETGLMGTHDEETEDYFKDTRVQCVLCPRNPDNGHTFVQKIEIATMFTHHQKILIVDSEVKNGASVDKKLRKIVSFIGGLDLCVGRYDTPSHSNFRTLGTVNHADFHQPNFNGASIKKGGPREPWHDIHCRLEGPVAWDVLYNFEQRWGKQGVKHSLVKIRNLGECFIPHSTRAAAKEENDTWNVQLFRSIDGGAAFGFPESPSDAAEVGLISGKDHTIDRSIQDAYINAIRRAKRFIYIENQYFIGSSFDWDKKDMDSKEVGALHLIPKELSLKIVSKIEAGERFTVYVVIPMWPEGEPDGLSVQAMLSWQKRTMEMMYKDIVQALLKKGIVDVNPKDYLSFFCLGNRECARTGEYVPPERPERGSVYRKAQQSRRFMIYVHAKMMIVDDEYIIIGSANINQRSMDGARDSEIAMGGYQPHHLSTKQSAKGTIHGLRMSLWYEHLGTLGHPSFLQPESLECIQMVNQIGKKHWELYIKETLDEDLPGHLLCYPIDVIGNGEVVTLQGSKFFPDTEARVLGSKPEIIPPIITT